MRAPDSPTTVAAPVLPDYRGACIANVVPRLLGGRDGAGRRPRLAARAAAEHARQVVLLVVDGLGWGQLRDRAALAPNLSAAAGIDRAITSVAPTTTAAALTSITTGRPPPTTGSSATGWPTVTGS